MDGETLGREPGLYVQRGMRPSLRHQIGERRRTHRIRGAHRPDPALETPATLQEADTAAQEPHTAVIEPDIAARTPHTAVIEPDIATWKPNTAMIEPDIAAQRVREAGGPSDLATYACECGYLFAASVTTTVGCPHCGTPQAW